MLSLLPRVSLRSPTGGAGSSDAIFSDLMRDMEGPPSLNPSSSHTSSKHSSRHQSATAAAAAAVVDGVLPLNTTSASPPSIDELVPATRPLRVLVQVSAVGALV